MQETGDLHGRTVFALLLIGMSLLSFSPQNLARTAKSTKAQSGSSLSKYENVTTHEGNLVISGTQTFIIENCTYIQTGNIGVRDSGTLVIRDSVFIVNQTYWGQFEITIDDHGSLVVESSQLESSSRMFGVWANGYASIVVRDDSASDYQWLIFGSSYLRVINSTTNWVWVGDSSRTSILNSSINLISFTLIEPSTFTIQDLKPQYFVSWKLNATSSLDLEVEDTTVKGWDLSIWGNAMVTVADSELNVHLGFHDYDQISPVVTLDGIKPGFYGIWDLHNNQSVQNVGYDLTLKNTTVDFWQISVWDNAKANIVNSVAHVHSDGEAKVDVENSTIQHLHVREDAEVTVINSAITGILTIRYYHGNLILNNTLISIGDYNIVDSDFDIWGDFNGSDLNKAGASWSSSNVTRSFNLVVRDVTHLPIDNTSLAIFDKSDVLVWNGATDSLGQADFNLTFTDSNHTDTLRLEAAKDNLSATESISFFSDTPVTMVLGAHDIAASNVTQHRTVVGQGYDLHTDITVANNGNFAETFNVTVYANGTEIGRQPVTLENGTSTIMMFTWNTSGFAYGNYTISAVADAVPNEADITDNNCTCNVAVHVGVPGDISGPTQGVYDGKCDMRDVSYLIIRFNSKPDSPNWNANADINNDGTVNMRDVQIAVLNFTKHE